MGKWLESVYSDGSEQFVSLPSPSLKDTVTIRIQIYENAPVRHVFLRTAPNGAEQLTEAKLAETSHGLAYYEASLTMTEKRMHYQFYLVCDDVIYYYTQNGITTYIPDHTYDFVLMADYVQPKWVKDQVFYQIFPERFCNGDPSLNVKDGEYEKLGYKTIEVKDWNARPMQYEEGHALDFYGGDLVGIKNKIPYLKELGVTAIYLNPIFTAKTTHKYDCKDYFHVDPHFGGDEALAELSKALHENGMRLILDISINHTGTDHDWFLNKKEYYFYDSKTGEYKGWFDNKDLPVLNYTSKELRDVVYKNPDSVLRKWLKPPYNIDGWRFDVADVFARNDEIQLSKEVWSEIRTAIREENPQAYILGEDWGDCGIYLQGEHWDSPMNYFGFGRIIRQYLGIGDLFENRNEILRNIHYKMTAKDVEDRVREHLAKIPFALWQNQFNLFDSHDVSRLHHENISFEAWCGAVIFQFMMIGTPSVYYGDEADIIGWTQTDAGYRAPMPWDSNFMEKPAYKLIHTLAHRKTDYCSLREGSMKFLYAKDDIISLARFTHDEAHVMVMNHSKEEQTAVIPVGAVGITQTGEKIEEIMKGSHEITWTDSGSMEITLAPEETILLYQKL